MYSTYAYSYDLTSGFADRLHSFDFCITAVVDLIGARERRNSFSASTSSCQHRCFVNASQGQRENHDSHITHH